MLALSVISGLGGDVQPPAPRPALGALTDTAGLADASAAASRPSPGATASPSASRTPAASASADPSASPGPPRQFSIAAGVLTARCTGSQAYLVSWSPAPGYRVDEVRRGPASVAVVSFMSGTQRLVFGVRCVSGVPRLGPIDE
jgi:hypothetical protein